MTRATSVEDYKLRGSFEAVRKTLFSPDYADRLDKPLAYWALPSDRRLPLAFLGRTVGNLLETPFEELFSTPGVGQKKIQSLIKLLHRAVRDIPSPNITSAHEDERVSKGEKNSNGREGNGAHGAELDFDPDFVSEALWGRWRETVRRHRLDRERLGRLAPSLQNLPTVIWRTPLQFYAERTLEEIRALRTHGEKRVRMVLEVFYVVNKLLAPVETDHRLALRLVPHVAAELDYWLEDATFGEHAPDVSAIQRNLAGPLLDQVRIDAGDAVYELAVERLGIGIEPQTVRLQSRRLGVTRARVYQLLDECGKIMAVRWPEGRGKVRSFQERIEAAGNADEARLCRALRELFYPEKNDPPNVLDQEDDQEG
jgi:hypothetical protein